MRRILLTLQTIFIFTIIAKAQFIKGDLLVGGQLFYSSNKTSSQYYNPTQKINYGNFEISIGKAIKENSIFGIDLSFSPYSQNNYSFGSLQGPLDYKNNSYSIGIYYRIYKSLGKDFYIFGEGGIAYRGSTESAKDSMGNKLLTGSGTGGYAHVMPGISYKVSKKFLLELTIPDLFSINYNSQDTKTGNQTYTTNNFYINSSLSSNPLNSLGIGIRLIL